MGRKGKRQIVKCHKENEGRIWKGEKKEKGKGEGGEEGKGKVGSPNK